MKKLGLFIIGFFFIVNSNGQIDKFSIGILGSPDYYNYQFNENEASIDLNSIFNFSAGISMRYKLNERFITRTGLLFSQKNFEVNYNWRLYPDDIYDPGFEPEFNKSKIILNYVDIPLLISYKFIDVNKMSVSASSGLIPSFLITDKEINQLHEGTEREMDYLKDIYETKYNTVLFNIDFELGVSYLINKTFCLSIDPYFRYGLNKLSDEILKSNPTSYGLKLGLHLNINSG